MITVDEPSNGAYYAGQVAVPYAKPLFTDIFNYLESKFSDENENAILRDIIIPEVRGMKLEEAKKALQDAGLTYDISGNGGTVKSITPYPGYSVKEGAKVTLNTETENIAVTYQQFRQVLDLATGALSNMYEQVKNLDDAMTDFKKVSDLQGTALNKYVTKLSQSGREVARTGKPNRSEPVCTDGKCA